MPLEFERLLEGLDGIAYLVDRDATIVALGRRNWAAFALANDGAALADGTGVLGHNLFDFIDGAAVAQVYRRWIDGLFAGTWQRGRMLSRCDGPTVERELMILITPILARGRVEHVLFQSVAVSEHVRPPLELFDFAAGRRRAMASPPPPIVAMCSYCQDVRYPPGSSETTGLWTSAADYYHRGGGTDVRISHGICPPCFARAEAALAQAPDAIGA